MSGASSSAAKWSSHLEPARRVENVFRRPDDPRLDEVIEPWTGDVAALTPGRAVLIGFPQDEGVRRNHGRPGASEAPHEIRQKLFRLTPYDGSSDTDLSETPPLDLGDVRIQGGLEQTQEALGEVVAGVLEREAVPVILGGGHETAFGHYLGYAALKRAVGVINIDAHLDVRPLLDGRGHSGSPFRQMMEYTHHPLPGTRYACLGAQPFATARDHWDFLRRQGGQVRWRGEIGSQLKAYVLADVGRFAEEGCQVYVSVDADATSAADVPAVSAPNADGFRGEEVFASAWIAGRSPGVASFDLVEINPRLDRDGQSTRWAALVIWNFLVGLSQRR